MNCNGYLDWPDGYLTDFIVYLDLNDNGVPDWGQEPYAYTYQTSSYTFTNLAPGTYSVAVVMQPGWRQVLEYPGSLLQEVAVWDGSTEYADVWGEGGYAFVAHRDAPGLDIIDLGRLEYDPSAAWIAHWSDGAGSERYLDVKVQNGIAFIASDGALDPDPEDGMGVAVVDVRNPFVPETIAVIADDGNPDPSLTGFNKVHNISVDGDFLYEVADTGNGRYAGRVAVFNISDPANPQKVQNEVRLGSNRLHDVLALRGRLYVSESQPGRVHIYRIQVEGPTSIVFDSSGIVPVPSGISTHSCWPTVDDDYLVVCKEPAGGFQPYGNTVDIWKISDLGNPTLRSSVQVPAPDAFSAHDPRVAGDRLYISWYQAGVVVFDMSDPTQPVELARHDPFISSGGQNGFWGVCPFLGPERILATDTENGLVVLRNAEGRLRVVIDAPDLTVTGADFLLCND